MTETGMLTLTLRSQVLTQNERGWNQWEVRTTQKRVRGSEAAVLTCDMWDDHSHRGAAQRVDEMAPRMNEVLAAARAKGVSVIHAPSDCMDFYADHPARRRMLAVPPAKPPAATRHANPPLPFEARELGSDTNEIVGYRAWTRQHPAIEILDEDVISDSGREVYSFLCHQGITNFFIMGVHTNMCVLHRTFGIKAMVLWGLDVALVRDMTDCIYNPALPPYVSHDEGTELVVGYIEKFWCPSVHSDDLRGAE